MADILGWMCWYFGKEPREDRKFFTDVSLSWCECGNVGSALRCLNISIDWEKIKHFQVRVSGSVFK